MPKFRTHYDNLNVSRNAPLSVIKAAYKALCQKYHPDKYIGGHDEALRIMKSINSAYAVLSDSGKRAEHDQWIAQQERAQASDEAQRIMTIITNAYVAPPVTNKPGPANSFRRKRWEGIHFGGLVNKPLVKKLTWALGFAGVVGIVSAAVVFYLPLLKTATEMPAHQDIAGILKKAEQFVKQGQAAKALPLYWQLAGQGNPDAQFQLGMMHAKGQGVAKDDKQAVEWFAKAAEQGYREAQTKLGYMYATGKGVAQSYVSAIFWCYKAAQQGDATAQYNLGLMYEQGQGVARDVSLAISWYSMAAAQGDARSQYNLGVMYENGVGVAKNEEQAKVLFRKAANQGLAEAVAALKKMDR